MSKKLTIEQHLANFAKTTEILLSLNEKVSQSNGWKLREIYIHLWAWDDQMIKACEAKITGKADLFKFDNDKKGIDIDTWNVKVIEEKRSLSFLDAKKLFKNTRDKTLATFKKVVKMPETITDPNSFLTNESIVTLWMHDKHHLEKASQKVNF